MKRLLLVFAILFASISSSFAYGAQTIETHGGGYNSMRITINSYLQAVSMNCSWSSLDPQHSSGSAVAFGPTASGDQLIGEYTYHSSMNVPYYANGLLYTSQQLYWTMITAYLSSYNCSGWLRVNWYD